MRQKGTYTSYGGMVRFTVNKSTENSWLIETKFSNNEPPISALVNVNEFISFLREFVEEEPVVPEVTLFDLTKNSRDQTVQVNVLGSKVTLNIEDLVQALKDAGITVS